MRIVVDCVGLVGEGGFSVSQLQEINKMSLNQQMFG